MCEEVQEELPEVLDNYITLLKREVLKKYTNYVNHHEMLERVLLGVLGKQVEGDNHIVRLATLNGELIELECPSCFATHPLIQRLTEITTEKDGVAITYTLVNTVIFCPLTRKEHPLES